jgi:type IV secretory pathway TrbL component
MDQTKTEAPQWAQSLRHGQHMREASLIASHAVREGDQPSSGDGPKLGDDK